MANTVEDQGHSLDEIKFDGTENETIEITPDTSLDGAIAILMSLEGENAGNAVGAEFKIIRRIHKCRRQRGVSFEIARALTISEIYMEAGMHTTIKHTTIEDRESSVRATSDEVVDSVQELLASAASEE